MFRIGHANALRRHLIGIFVAFAACASALEANAQIINQYFPQGVPGYDTGLGVTVQSRARDKYVPPGIRLGDIMINSSFNETVGYNSNVTGLQKGRGGLQIDTSLALQASSQWTRDGIFGYLNVGQLNFPQFPSQNQTNWVASLGGVHDFGRDQLSLSYSHFNLQQTAADIAGLNFEVPETFRVDDFRTSYRSDFGRASVTPSLEVTNYTFDQTTDSGILTGQEYRDRIVVRAGTALRYELSAPQRNAVLVFNGYDASYQHPLVGQPSRDNTGFSALVGFEYTASGVFRYRGLIGLERRMYADTAFASQMTPIGEGEVIWTPTELTTVTLFAERAIEDAASVSTVGFVYTAAKIVIDHEYRRNILLQGYAGIQAASYQEGGGSQTISNSGGKVLWLLNRNVRLAATYDFTASNASSSPTNFVGNTYHRSIYLLQLSLAL